MSSLAALTYTRARGLRTLPAFLRLSLASIRAAQRAPGNRGVRFRARSPLDWYTVTVWEDEEAMVAFVRGEAHMEAMRATRHLTQATRFARVTLDGARDELPWREVVARLHGAAGGVGRIAGAGGTGPSGR